MPVTIRYKFTQHFKVSSEKVYLWCTDFSPLDPELLCYFISERQVTPLSEGLMLLIDTLRAPQSVVEKQKLVHLYPDKKSWTLTHITGTTKHSQFHYEIMEDPDGCHLNYEALHVDQEKNENSISDDERLQLAKTLYKKDSEMWQHLAAEMQQELT